MLRRNPLKRRASLPLSRAHRKTKNCRLDFQHKLSINLVNTYSLIAVGVGHGKKRLKIDALSNDLIVNLALL
ncbi:hypothetical protein [Candidatus Chlorohelix sp.]|uniref:hypothetical protein n=1 Tax=Candidatus Chlorohelix sp. TaxID=3139201 RepID=UPI00303DF484